MKISKIGLKKEMEKEIKEMGTEFKDEIEGLIDRRSQAYTDISDAIWGYAGRAAGRRTGAGRQHFDRRRASDGRGICKADRLDEFIADPSVRSGNAEEDGGFLRIGVG